MALVENVRGLQTTDATHDMAEALALQLGKSPITVKSGPGFLVNRILLPMINEAFFVLKEMVAAGYLGRKTRRGVYRINLSVMTALTTTHRY